MEGVRKDLRGSAGSPGLTEIVDSEKQEKRLVYFNKRIRELAVEDEAPKPILQGRHLIEKGLEPGPQFKSILSMAYEAQLKGAFDDLDGALDWMKGESLV